MARPLDKSLAYPWVLPISRYKPVALRGALRTIRAETMLLLEQRMWTLAGGFCATVELDFRKSSVINSLEQTTLIADAAAAMVGVPHVAQQLQ